MNRAYPNFLLNVLWNQDHDPGAATWACQYVDTNAEFNPTHTVLDDLSFALLGTAETIPTVAAAATTDGLDIAGDFDPALELDLDLNDQVNALLIFIDTGDPTTSPLVCWIDTRFDTTDVAYESDGDPADTDFPPDGVFLRI